MTYIDYLNAFNRRVEHGHLSPTAQLLYFKLLDVFNVCGWPEWVSVDNFRLMGMVQVAKKDTLWRARDALVSGGFIEYRKGKKGTPSQFKLIQLDQCFWSVFGVECGAECGVECGVENGSQMVPHNKTKTKTTPQKEKPPTGVKRKTPPIPTQEETGFSAVLQSAFEEWLAYKHERKQEYKPRGLAALQNKIREAASAYGDKAAANCILDCIASNYQGLFFDRIKGEMKGVSNDDYWKL